MTVSDLWNKFQYLIFSYGGGARHGKRLWAICFSLFMASSVCAQTNILAFGDSLTQGYGLPQSQGFVPQLETWLKQNGSNVRLINGGVSGDTTAGGAARIDWSLDPSVDAVILCLGGNDALRALPPEATHANLDKILQTITARKLPVLLIGMKAPNNYGADYKTQFDGLFPKLAAKYDVNYADDFFAPLRAISQNPAELRDYFQPDGIHPNAKGVNVIVDAIGPYVLDLMAPSQ